MIENKSEDKKQEATPQFVSIGHFTHDITEDGLILGGAASYSSIAARRLGWRTGVVSAVGRDFLHLKRFDGIPIALAGTTRNLPPEGSLTTTFTNTYENGVRSQVLSGVASQICPEHIPPDWLNAEIVYLCPVANEIHPAVVNMFPDSLIGASPQGWMRQWDDDGRVSQRKWKDAPEVLPHVDVVVMSEEDITPFPEIVYEYAELADIVVLTRGEKGATLFQNGQQFDSPAFTTCTVDPTGAGDVFAAAFLGNFYQTRDVHKAATFANYAASFVVEKEGTEGIPDLARVRSRICETSGSGSV